MNTENEEESNITQSYGFSTKKKLFIKAYLEHLGSITGASRAVKMERQTYYDWRKSDPKFAEYIDNIDVDDFLLGEAKKGLLKNIQKGDVASIIFTLKSKGKGEGFTEKQEVAHSGGFTLNETRTYQEKPPQEKDE